jgi:hypothetical protein
MTERDFRTIALSMPEAVEGAHMGHPDFRVAGKIFATLRYPRRGFGMVRLTPEQQELFVKTNPDGFTPVPGKWGERGATHVHLRSAGKKEVREALTIAWQNHAAPPTTRRQRKRALPPE